MATAVIETKGRIKEVHIEGLVSLHFSLFIFIVLSVSVSLPYYGSVSSWIYN